MARREGWVLLIILALLAFSVWVLNPIDSERFGRNGIQYGLDLQGGVRLVYQVEVPPGQESTAAARIDDVVAVIANRVNPLGVTEPNIEKRTGNRIVVEIPNLSVTDVQKDRIGRTALLEFREGVEIKDEQGNVIGVKWIPATAVIDGQEKVLNSGYFSDRTVVEPGDPGEGMTIAFEWTTEGAQVSKVVTERLLKKPMAIFEGSGEDALPLLGEDGTPITPTVQAVITDRGRITNLSLKDAQELSKQLNAGRLPLELTIIDEENIDPSAGADLVNLSVRAGLIGIAAVMIFMIAYYRIPGVVASLSLAFYAALTLAIYKLIPVTMTLAGIGGFVLSVGMAVDASVLIFERMKEELMSRTTLTAAMEAGFSRAWSAIWDSNVTTILACFILYWVGDTVVLGGAAVKGFALTLGIGVMVSMFTAIVTSRTLLRLIARTGISKQHTLFSPYTGRKLA